MDGSSMRVVDTAVVNLGKVSPNVTANTVKVTLIACFLTALVIAVIAFFDDTIRDEDFLTDNYDLPILSRIPDLADAPARAARDGYGYGYGYGDYRHYGSRR